MRTLLLALAVTALGFAPAPLPRPDRGRAERNRLFGTWILKQVKYAGTTTYSGAGLGNTVIYLAEEVTITEGEMRILNRDPNARRGARSLAIQVQSGTANVDFGPFPNGTPGLFRVEGRTLTISYPPGARKSRPTAFDNTNDIVLIFERVGR